MRTLRRSSRSRCCTSASTCILHSRVAPDVISMKLSIPNPNNQMLPAMASKTMATTPSRLFHAIVKYSNRFPRSYHLTSFLSERTHTISIQRDRIGPTLYSVMLKALASKGGEGSFSHRIRVASSVVGDSCACLPPQSEYDAS